MVRQADYLAVPYVRGGRDTAQAALHAIAQEVGLVVHVCQVACGHGGIAAAEVAALLCACNLLVSRPLTRNAPSSATKHA